MRDGLQQAKKCKAAARTSEVPTEARLKVSNLSDRRRVQGFGGLFFSALPSPPCYSGGFRE